MLLSLKASVAWSRAKFMSYSGILGTRTYGILDGNCSNGSGAFLMAITEKVHSFMCPDMDMFLD